MKSSQRPASGTSYKLPEEAARSGSNEVRLEHVTACRERFLHNHEDEVRGYSVETCLGTGGCSNAAVIDTGLADTIEKGLDALDIRSRIRAKIQGPLKMHHEFRVSISQCPNACSRPQIVDVGLIGARIPQVVEEACKGCMGCVEACREKAVSFWDKAPFPVIDSDRCLGCGACIAACPTGTIAEKATGYRILVGGRLGRHPRLGSELPDVFSREDVERIVPACAGIFLDEGTGDERFGDLVERLGMDRLMSAVRRRWPRAPSERYRSG
ncbi:MAG: 4Fe-4S binding protein [Deltaproteobacteria bacterium]